MAKEVVTELAARVSRVAEQPAAVEPHPVGLAILGVWALVTLVLLLKTIGLRGVFFGLFVIVTFGVGMAFWSLGAVTDRRY